MDRANEPITVIHSFDDRYAIPAGVAFQSMLERADPRRRYRLIVLTSDVSSENRAKLSEIVARFPQATLEFVRPAIDLAAEFDTLGAQGHYSKDVLYKLLMPRLFPDVRRAIVTDVDCVYQGDVSEPFDLFFSSGDFHLGGISYADRPLRRCSTELEAYRRLFSESERARLRRSIGGGFLVCDFERMRRDGEPEELLNYLRVNAHRLQQAEQDVINLTESLRIRRLPVRTMVCSYLYDWLEQDERSSWSEDLARPIQLHYATAVKPWNEPRCARADLWWECVARTPFYRQAMEGLIRVAQQKTPKPDEQKTVWKAFGLLPMVHVRAQGDVSRVRLAGLTLTT